MGIPKLECVVDELAVLAQRTDHGMIAQKWQHFLLWSLTLDERSDGPEMKGRVSQGNFAGLLNRPEGWRLARLKRPRSTRVPSMPRAWIMASAQAALCGPSRMATLPKSDAAPRSTPADLLCSDVFGRGTEAAWFLLDVRRNLLHPLVEDPHHASRPIGPKPPAPGTPAALRNRPA